MKSKIEIVEFADGQYAIRRTRSYWYKDDEISLLDLCSRGRWYTSNTLPDIDCFTRELKVAQRCLTLNGYATGVPVDETNILSFAEFEAMNTMAKEGDEGMIDVLTQAKTYYYLKKQY